MTDPLKNLKWAKYPLGDITQWLGENGKLYEHMGMTGHNGIDIVRPHGEHLFAATEGIVVEALGVGNVPPAAFEGIKYAAEMGIPIVLVSRCPAGETDYVYSYPGAGVHLHNLGVMFTDFLNGQKARIKLMLALGKQKITKN